jgi:toxin CcdB
MAQFEVYRLGGGPQLVVDCQSDLLDHIDTRFVVPLVPPEEAPPPVRRLNPLFEIGGRELVLLTQSAGAVRCSLLGRPIASLTHRDREIMNALDLLITGV